MSAWATVVRRQATRCLIGASAALIAACAWVEPSSLADLPGAEDAGMLSADTDNGWPRTVTSGNQEITIYEPQVDSWERNQLQARAAVSVQASALSQPTYGVISFSARTEVDKQNRLVTLQDMRFTRTSFPSEPQHAEEYAARIQPQIQKGMQKVALDRLQASLVMARTEATQKSVEVRNAPPHILFSTSPAVLVLIDGEPILREVPGTHLSRIINTRALMLLDPTSGTYYFSIAERWMQARALTGPWTWAETERVPQSLALAKQAAVQDNRVDTPNLPLVYELEAIVPTIYVSTVPAELIQTEGQPELEPIAGTSLLEVTNSPSDIFLDQTDQQYYVLLSGRWYRGRSLDRGPWAFVSAKALPPEFAQIPESDPKGAVLASVAGTAQAQQAMIANAIPQTATVQRSQARLDVRYDGSPVFKPVCGTALLYAINSATPVIRVTPNSYYAVDSGIWFTAGVPTGPWTAAQSVPDVIYSIQPCSPIYNVTHVYVYGATPEVVYAGYTPGYFGSYVSPDDVVVYGTGYVYAPWVGAEWIGAPATFGFDVGWGSGFEWGFSGLGFGIFAGSLFHPWWDPYGWGWGHRDLAVENFHHANIYRSSWRRDVFRDRWDRHELANRQTRLLGDERARNALFAGHDGLVYRGSPSALERHERGDWHAAPHDFAAGRAGFGGAEHEIGRESAARDMGARNWSAFRGSGSLHAGGLHGGGFAGRGHAFAGASRAGIAAGGRAGGGGFHGGGGHGGGGHR